MSKNLQKKYKVMATFLTLASVVAIGSHSALAEEQVPAAAAAPDSESVEVTEGSEVESADSEKVFYNGQWIELSDQPSDIEQATPVITEENQGTLGQSLQGNPLARTLRSESFFDPSDNSNPPTDFVDVASYQGDLSKADYEAMKKYGIRGVVVKLTEGTSYKNPNAKAQINNAKAAGIKVSAYHFSWFTSKQQAEAEADFFAATARELGLDVNTVMVNDAENSVMNNGFATDNSIYFALRLINQHGFKSVIHYSYANWFNTGVLNKNKLDAQSTWIAQYPTTPSSSNLLHKDSAGWQWTSQIVFPEIAGKRFDTNVDYLGYFVGQGAAVAPPKVLSIAANTTNTENGKFKVTIKVESDDAVQQIKVPIWSASDQSNIKWYNAEKINNDTWTVDFDVHNHGGLEGAYTVHAYVTTINGLNGSAVLPYTINVKGADSEAVPVYRVYNPNSSEHFYTTNIAERNMLHGLGWHDEGLGWLSTKDGAPVYRVYNPNSGDHHYTTSKDEVNSLVKKGWKAEGVSWNSNGETPIHRVYNPNQKGAGAHHFTKDSNEKESLVKAGWRYEGVSWKSK